MESLGHARAVLDDALAGHRAALESVEQLSSQIDAAATAIADSISADKTVLFVGNGGSAADAQHLAAELVGRFERERDAWPALALHTNTSALTAVGNDYGFDRVFARQVQAHGRAGGVLVALSTSGHSANVAAAVEAAHTAGMTVVALTGRDGGPIGAASDIHLNVAAASTARVQEMHILIGHVICGLVEERLCEKL